MGTQTAVQALIDSVYDAALGSEATWRAAFGRVATTLGVAAAGVKLQGVAPDSTFVQQTWSGLPPAFESAFVAEFWREDPWTLGSFDHSPGVFLLSREMVPDRVLRRSRFYRELCQPHGLHDAMGACLFRTDELYVTFGMMRPEGARGDGSALAEHGSALLPHLARAVRLRIASERMRATQAAVAGALDESPVATWVVDARGRVLHGNTRAHALVAEQAMTVAATGLLCGGHPADTRRLHEACERVALSGRRRGATLLSLRRPGAVAPLCALVRAASAPDGALTGPLPALAIVHIIEPELRAGPSASLLRAMFQLTPAETRLCQLLSEGLTPSECAAQLERSITTVRSQLSIILAKTGNRRQSELTRLLGAIASHEGLLHHDR